MRSQWSKLEVCKVTNR